MGIKLLVLAILILVNAFFAGVEVAFLSVNTNKIKQKADEGDERALLLKKMIDNPSRFLATIQVGISFAGLFSGAFAGQAFAEPIVAALVSWGVTLSPEILTQIIILAITVLLSYFSLVFGELVPKRVAMKNAYGFSMACVGFVNGVSKCATPFVKLLSFSTNTTLRLLGIDPDAHNDDVTEEEIRLMVDVGRTSGSIDESEKAMINNVFEFDNKSAEDIATHRKDILALPVDASRESVIKAVTTDQYSRIPVYEENIDNIVGILHIKDFFNHILKNENGETLDLRGIMRKPYFVPDSKKTDELFEEMQKNKVHIAIIVDEYGGTAGIVTMEDLIEEIMGNILDEYDDEEKPEIEAIDSHTFLINGMTDLETVSDLLGIPLPVDDYDTISGFLIGQLGRIPLEKEQPEIQFNGLVFQVRSVEEKRIASVLALIPEEPADEGDAERDGQHGR